MERNFYQVLGVRRDAGAADIRATYVRLVKRHHPDMVGNLPARLRDVQQAYRCLSDPDARAAHDRRLIEDERAHHAHARSVRRRLDRYDHRHPAPPPRLPRKPRWRTVLIVALGAGAALRWSLGLF